MGGDDKSKKIGDKKIGKVDVSQGTDSVEGADAVEDAAAVAGVESVGGIGSIERSDSKVTHRLSSADRDQLFALISDEAKKLFDGTELPEEKRQAIEEAVKMAIDSGLIEEEENLKQGG